MSAGFKHFGKRRLGRSGLDRSYPIPDNVWDIDCTSLFKINESNVHSAYFENPYFPLTHNNLGNTYEQIGNSEKAMAEYTAALKIDSNYADAHNNVGAM